MDVATTEDSMAWNHANDVCKLIRIPRDEINADDDYPDAWNLVCVDSDNVRRIDVILNSARGRADTLSAGHRGAIAMYAAGAPDAVLEILRPFILAPAKIDSEMTMSLVEVSIEFDAAYPGAWKYALMQDRQELSRHRTEFEAGEALAARALFLDAD